MFDKNFSVKFFQGCELDITFTTYMTHIVLLHFLYAINHATELVDLMLFIQKYVEHMVKRMETNWVISRGLFQKIVINLDGFENMIF